MHRATVFLPVDPKEVRTIFNWLLAIVLLLIIIPLSRAYPDISIWFFAGLYFILWVVIYSAVKAFVSRLHNQ